MHQKQKGRLIERSQYQQQVDNNAKRIAKNKEVYKRRQAIVEHPYGTLKRQWGFDHIITKKGMKRASADVGLMFCAYNLRRIMNLVGKTVLKAWLVALACFFECLWAHFKPKWRVQFWHLVFLPPKLPILMAA